MFYSQFILAKKGPLGTIWIAAHLERKLRKNQVADTDIGVSVDSILSPDIPIALRLSSHLLLGVVRIYSRKVNYLFHDCSETLLKVKQAFRSTVVDLPPEESTAPYHSITLPETFDLDDFVLPDALNGNFVDHHVSTREQITLQDSLEGTGHPTLQFGLDERFGDGDAPQIALDLDEEMLLDKGVSDHTVSTPSALVEKVDIQTSVIPETPCAEMDIDDCQEVGTPRNMPPLQDPSTATGFSDLHGYNIQAPNLKDVYPSEDVGAPSAVINDMEASYPQNNGPPTDSHDHAEAPSTPGLAEEATPSRVHETHAISPQCKTSPPNIVDDFMSETKKGFRDPTYQDGANPPLTKSCNELPSGAAVCDEDGQNIFEAPGDKLCHNNAAHNRNLDTDILAEEVGIESRTGELNNKLEMDKSVSLDPQYQNIATEANGCHSGHKTTLGFDSSLKPCTSQSNQSNIAPPEGQLLGENGPHPSVGEMLSVDGASNADNSSLEKQGEGLDSAMDLEMHQKLGHLPSKNQADHSRQDELSTIVSNDTQLGTLNFSASSEYPEPEKMLSAPDGYGMQNDLELGTSEKGTRESDEGADGNKSLSGKKRHLERTPDLHSDSSVKVSGASRSKRRIDHIPNDDDLLASILVGRGASTLKMKSTPSLPTVPSSKRSRLMPNIGAPKRKVLLDDIMVLHADAIRQQLISTEDIRRTRRKAPCTRSDVWMIQKSFSEDEIFGESVLTGTSVELTGLYRQTYELNGIEGYRDDANHSFPDASKSGFTSLKFVENASHGRQVYPSSEKTDSPAPPSDSHPHIVTRHCETDENSHGHDHLNSKLLGDKQDSDPQLVTERCEKDKNSCEHDHLNSKLLNDKSNLLLDQSSLGEVVHHPGKDESSIFNNDDHITKDDDTLTESRNTCIINETSLISPQDFIGEHHSVNGETFSSANTSCVDVGHEKIMEPMDVRDANTCTPNFPAENSNSVDRSAITNDQVAVEAQEGQLEASVDQIGSSLCPPESSDVKTVMSPPELTCLQVPNLQNNVDVQDLPSHPNTKDSDGYGSVTGGNVTDFLADDEADLDDEINYDVANPEVQSLENSGWSVRTRGVARYLRLLFDNDSGCGRMTVDMDRLLAGKTRKEASRMFFETLVLKTNDYVNAEQGNSFENINIKPTAKLLKSEF